jgi:hypothetical protein
MAELREVYSKWELDERTGARYRTVSMSVPNFSHTFAMEVLGAGHRKLVMEGAPEFSGYRSEFKRLHEETEKQKIFVSRVQYEPEESKTIL